MCTPGSVLVRSNTKVGAPQNPRSVVFKSGHHPPTIRTVPTFNNVTGPQVLCAFQSKAEALGIIQTTKNSLATPFFSGLRSGPSFYTSQGQH